MAEVTVADVARRLGVPPATLRRWVRTGVVPLRDGVWTPAAIAPARIVLRLRERGHTLAQIRDAAARGQLATGFPLVAFLQLIRVYGQALAQIADAEVKLKGFSEPTELFLVVRGGE